MFTKYLYVLWALHILLKICKLDNYYYNPHTTDEEIETQIH